jgi:hypothetical protein
VVSIPRPDVVTPRWIVAAVRAGWGKLIYQTLGASLKNEGLYRETARTVSGIPERLQGNAPMMRPPAPT